MSCVYHFHSRLETDRGVFVTDGLYYRPIKTIDDYNALKRWILENMGKPKTPASRLTITSLSLLHPVP